MAVNIEEGLANLEKLVKSSDEEVPPSKRKKATPRLQLIDRLLLMRSRKALVFLVCSLAAILASLTAQEMFDAAKAGDLAKVKALVSLLHT